MRRDSQCLARGRQGELQRLLPMGRLVLIDRLDSKRSTGRVICRIAWAHRADPEAATFLSNDFDEPRQQGTHSI